MTRTLSSVSEITRVGGWALRGIGYPFGVAERGVRLLAWAEAVGARAIRHLRQAEPAIARSHAAAPVERARDGQSGWRVDARQRHLLEIGPPLVDLATSDARRHGAGHVTAQGVFGFGMLPALADLLVQRGLTAVLAYRAAQADTLPDGMPRVGWMLAGHDGHAIFAWGKLDGTVLDALRIRLQAACAAGPAWIESDIADALMPAEPGYLGLLAINRDQAGADAGALLACLQAAGIRPEVADYRAQMAEALRDGVPVTADDLRYLYELEMRTWAPTSERSRNQAGYGVY